MLSNDGYSSQFYCSFANTVRQLRRTSGLGLRSSFVLSKHRGTAYTQSKLTGWRTEAAVIPEDYTRRTPYNMSAPARSISGAGHDFFSRLFRPDHAPCWASPSTALRGSSWVVRAHRSPQQWPCRFSRRAPPEGPPEPIMKASNDGKFCFWHRLFPDFCPSHWPPAPAAPAPATFDNYLAGVAAYHQHSLTLAGSAAQFLRNPVQAPAVCSALASLLQNSKLPSRAKRPLAWRETQGILEQGFALTPTGRLHSRPLWMLCTLRLLRRGAVVALRVQSPMCGTGSRVPCHWFSCPSVI